MGTTLQHLEDYRPLDNKSIIRQHVIAEKRFNALEGWERHQADILSHRLAALDIIMSERKLFNNN